MVVTRGKGVGKVAKGKGCQNVVTEGDLTLDGKHTMQRTDDIS